ncbi:MAG TPA: LamG-like jellyroll fold domain-containing protein [Armatimonadota bacterium]|nr:LamG-like jellyroll fold domain-containing protein [Armatimonadota bacterium]
MNNKYFDVTPTKNGVTIACWVSPKKITSTDYTKPTTIFNLSNSANWDVQMASIGMSVAAGPTSSPDDDIAHFVFAVAADGGKTTVDGRTSLKADTWYYVVGSASPTGGVHLYVNGAEDASSKTIKSIDNYTTGVITLTKGGGGSGKPNLNGSVANCAIYYRQMEP